MAPAPLRLVFAGTPDFAARHLARLLDSQHRIAAVYTQPDRPAGRGKRLQASPVKALALERDLPVRQPESLKGDAAVADLAALEPDVMVVVAYGLILPRGILATPRYGCLNVHASLLPRWRGAAPIQRAVEAGDAETGVTIMQMDEGLDTGAMLAHAACPIAPRATAATLHDELAALGAPLLCRVLDDLDRFRAGATPQPEEGASYAGKIRKEEAAGPVTPPCWTGGFAPFTPPCATWRGAGRIRRRAPGGSAGSRASSRRPARHPGPVRRWPALPYPPAAAGRQGAARGAAAECAGRQLRAGRPAGPRARRLMALDSRAAAARAVAGVLAGKSLARPATALERWPRDRGLLQQLSYGTLRHYPRLRGCLIAAGESPARPRPAGTAAVGLYQLKDPDTPSRCCFSHRGAPGPGKQWARGW